MSEPVAQLRVDVTADIRAAERNLARFEDALLAAAITADDAASGIDASLSKLKSSAVVGKLFSPLADDARKSGSVIEGVVTAIEQRMLVFSQRLVQDHPFTQLGREAATVVAPVQRTADAAKSAASSWDVFAAAEARAAREASQIEAAQLRLGLASSTAAQRVDLLKAAIAKEEAAAGTNGAATKRLIDLKAQLVRAEQAAEKEADRAAAALTREAKAAEQAAAKEEAAAKRATAARRAGNSENGGAGDALGPALPRTFAGFSGEAAQAVQSLTGIATAAGPAAAAVLALGKAFSIAKEDADLVGRLDENRRTLGILLGDVKRGNQVWDEAVQFGRKYAYTQEEIGTSVSAATAIIKNSKAPVENILSVLARLNQVSPEQGLEGAAFALKELQSGDSRSLVERFELPRAALNKLRDEVRNGGDAVLLLDRYLTDMGVTADVIKSRTEGYAGAQREAAAASEELAIKVGNLASGPMETLIRASTRVKRGLGNLFDLGGGNSADLQKQADLAVLQSHSVEELTANYKRLDEANAGVAGSYQRLTPEQFTFLQGLSESQRMAVLQAGTLSTWTDAQNRASNALQEAHVYTDGNNEALDRAQQLINALGGAMPATTEQIYALAAAYIEANRNGQGGTEATDRFTAAIAALAAGSPEAQAQLYAEAAATDAVNLAQVAAVDTTYQLIDATAQAAIAEAEAAAAKQNTAATQALLTDLLMGGTTALDQQAQATLIAAVQHDYLRQAQEVSAAAAAGSINSYLASGGAITELGLRALAATDALTALALAQGKKVTGITGRGGGARNKAALIEAGYDPDQKGARQAVGDAAKRLVDPASAAAELADAKASADAFNRANQAAIEARRKLANVGKTKEQLVAEARADLARLKPGTAAAIQQQAELDNLLADLASSKPSRGRGAGGRQGVVDRDATAGESVATQLAYYRKRLAGLKVGSTEYLKVHATIKRLEAQQERANGREAVKVGNAALADEAAGEDTATQLAVYRKKLAGLRVGSAEYLAVHKKIKQLEAKQTREQDAAAGRAGRAGDAAATAGESAAEQLAYYREKIKGLKSGSEAYLRMLAKIKTLEAKVAKEADRDRKEDLRNDLASASKAEQLARYREELGRLTKGTDEYAATLRKVADLERDVAKARNDAALDEVHDKQDRLKEDRELATIQRVLASATASAEQKEAARLRQQEIQLEREKRGLQIAEKRREAGLDVGQSAVSPTAPAAAPRLPTSPPTTPPPDRRAFAALEAASSRLRTQVEPGRVSLDDGRLRTQVQPGRTFIGDDGRMRTQVEPGRAFIGDGRVRETAPTPRLIRPVAPPVAAQPPAVTMRPRFGVKVFVGGRELVQDIKVQVVEDQRRAWNVADTSQVGEGL